MRHSHRFYHRHLSIRGVKEVLSNHLLNIIIDHHWTPNFRLGAVVLSNITSPFELSEQLIVTVEHNLKVCVDTWSADEQTLITLENITSKSALISNSWLRLQPVRPRQLIWSSMNRWTPLAISWRTGHVTRTNCSSEPVPTSRSVYRHLFIKPRRFSSSPSYPGHFREPRSLPTIYAYSLSFMFVLIQLNCERNECRLQYLPGLTWRTVAFSVYICIVVTLIYRVKGSRMSEHR